MNDPTIDPDLIAKPKSVAHASTGSWSVGQVFRWLGRVPSSHQEGDLVRVSEVLGRYGRVHYRVEEFKAGMWMPRPNSRYELRTGPAGLWEVVND